MNLFLLVGGIFLAHQVCHAQEASKAWGVSNNQAYNGLEHCKIYNLYNNHYYYYNNTTAPEGTQIYPIPSIQQITQSQPAQSVSLNQSSSSSHGQSTQNHGKNPQSIVSRSKNSVDRSRNYILQPSHKSDLITRAGSSILNAPTGLTDVTTLTMETDIHITTTVEFIGSTAINGNGNILYLDAGGALQIDTLSSVAIKNVTIKGVRGNNIFCVDNTGNITVQNVTWIQNSDFTFNHGSFDVMNDFHCIGNGLHFLYSTSQGCTIHSGATMTLDYNFTFEYVPASGLDNLFTFADQTSTIHLLGGSLYAGSSGLALKSGLLFFDGLSSFATASGPGISMGDGTNGANDTICIFGSAATLDLTGGSLTYNNVLASSWNMRDINATLTIFPGTTFDLLQTLDLGSGNLLLSTSASFVRPPGVQVIGSVSFF